MDVLFVHGNFPGQFQQLAMGMARQPSNRVVFLTNRHNPDFQALAGVEVRRFDLHRSLTKGIHPYLQSSEQAVLSGQGVIRAVANLLEEGFCPRLVIAHGGNGLLLFLRQLLPNACLTGYFEWWFQDEQARWLFAVDSLDARMQMCVRNGITLQELELSDLAVTPTEWQRQQFPSAQRQRLQVAFDGVDTGVFRPRAWNGVVRLQGREQQQPLELHPQQRVLSMAARGLEPLRGFPEFMRMLPDLMRRYPDLQVVVAGQDRVAYSYPAPTHAGSWKSHLLKELEGQLDRSRLHFTGLLNYGDYIALLQRSDLHTVFSRPYVISWGLFQAAACGARLLLNRDEAIQSVVKEDDARWVNLDHPVEVQEEAAVALDSAIEERNQKRVSALKPEWEINACLRRWQTLINQTLKPPQAALESDS